MIDPPWKAAVFQSNNCFSWGKLPQIRRPRVGNRTQKEKFKEATDGSPKPAAPATRRRYPARRAAWLPAQQRGPDRREGQDPGRHREQPARTDAQLGHPGQRVDDLHRLQAVPVQPRPLRPDRGGDPAPGHRDLPELPRDLRRPDQDQVLLLQPQHDVQRQLPQVRGQARRRVQAQGRDGGGAHHAERARRGRAHPGAPAPHGPELRHQDRRPRQEQQDRRACRGGRPAPFCE